MRGRNSKPPEGKAPPPGPRELELKQLRKKLADAELERDIFEQVASRYWYIDSWMNSAAWDGVMFEGSRVS